MTLHRVMILDYYSLMDAAAVSFLYFDYRQYQMDILKKTCLRNQMGHVMMTMMMYVVLASVDSRSVKHEDCGLIAMRSMEQ